MTRASRHRGLPPGGDSPVTLSQESGAKYLTFAFIQTASAGSCTAYWNGDTSQPIAAATFGSDIADGCTSVSSIAKVYENVITTSNVPRIDLDIEENSLTNTAGINRRSEAVAQVESWAAANGRSIQFSYTMPSTNTGMDSSDAAVIQNAIADGAKVSVVNLVTFDYYIGTSQEMATDTETAASGLESQLHSLYPADTSAQLWGMIGVTEMPGIDDYGPGETFTEADGTTVASWAKSKGISTLSFWALQRDNGGCPGTAGSDTCSGISQPTWYFSHTFEPFTSGSGGGGGGAVITGNNSGLCLSVTGNSSALKATADISTCDGDSLSVSGGATSPGAIADIYTCNGSASENWTVG